MATIQRRWYCKECKREWIRPSTGMYVNSSPVFFAGNGRSTHCHVCGGQYIEMIEYLAPFPGGDLPRGEPVILPEGANIEDYPVPEGNIGAGQGHISNNLIAALIKEQEKK